jgi:uncharacterized membrane protein
MRRTPVPPALRFLAYGLVGWTADSVFVWVHTGRRRPTSLLNVPVYGLALPLFEPVHDRIRNQPAALRAALYGAGILGVEYTSGRVLRTLLGRAPWDYGDARFAVDRLVRLDYLPLWALYGLALERVHDVLVASEIETRAREYREAVTASPPPARARDLG